MGAPRCRLPEQVAQAQPVDARDETGAADDEASESDYTHLTGQAGGTGKRLAIIGLVLLAAAAVYQGVAAESVPDFLKTASPAIG